MTRKPAAPAVLPTLDAVAVAGDAFTLSLDGRPLGVPVPRARLGQALARAAGEAATPVRVRIREADGTSYTDILEPARSPEPRAPAPSGPVREFVVAYEGFLPGEIVLIAVVDRTMTAGSDGRITLPALPSTAQAVRRDVVVFGTRSGTAVLGAIG